jgi:hypothetical protein
MKFRSIALLVLTAIFSSLNHRAFADNFPLSSNYLLTQNLSDTESLPSFCGDQEKTILAVETKDFFVSICGSDRPITYVGVSKKDKKIIRLPLSDYDPNNTYYEAKNDNYTYYLIRGTAKGDFLGVTDGNKQILQQPILRWQDWQDLLDCCY